MESLYQSQYNCIKQVEIGEKTVIQMYQYLRDVCTTKLLNTPIQLGSQDVVKAKLPI